MVNESLEEQLSHALEYQPITNTKEYNNFFNYMEQVKESHNISQQDLSKKWFEYQKNYYNNKQN